MPLVSVKLTLLGGIIFFAGLVSGLCECGYRMASSFPTMALSGSTDPAFNSIENDFLFTDIIETDAFHIANFHEDTDWSVQNYAVSASSARGPYG